MSPIAWSKARACWLAVGLLAAVGAPPARAGTGVHWSFVNHTTQDIHLQLTPDRANGSCWDVSAFPADAVVPAGQTGTYYVEFDCVDTELTVQVSDGPYRGERVKLWVDSQWPGRLKATRNVLDAQGHKSLNWASLSIGTSSSDMTTSLRFTGQGWLDTALAGVAFAARHIEPPPGSYRSTCNADYDGDTLRADCLGSAGGMDYGAELRYPRLCAKDSPVTNDDGQPSCERYDPQLPRGSYLESCRPLDFDAAGGKLHAACDSGSGSSVVASLNAFYACEPGSTLSNQHGALACDRPFVPGGSYGSACQDVRYDGQVLSGACRSFTPLGRLSLDYAAACAPWSTVSLDLSNNQLACDTPKAARPAVR